MIVVRVWYQIFYDLIPFDKLVAIDCPLIDLRTLFPGCESVELLTVVR